LVWQPTGCRRARGAQDFFCKEKSVHAIFTRSKNACLQGHFYDAVNWYGNRQVAGEPEARRIFFVKKNPFMQSLPGVKMLACKGIFTTPSIGMATDRLQASPRLAGFFRK